MPSELSQISDDVPDWQWSYLQTKIKIQALLCFFFLSSLRDIRKVRNFEERVPEGRPANVHDSKVLLLSIALEAFLGIAVAGTPTAATAKKTPPLEKPLHHYAATTKNPSNVAMFFMLMPFIMSSDHEL